MARSFSRAQVLQNRAFLAALARSGNARAAARELGLHRSTMLKRRGKSAAFALEWDAALALAQSRLATARLATVRRAADQAPPASARHPAPPRITLLKSGRLQVRRAPKRRLDAAAEQAFLAALSATANVRLSAAAAGFSHSAFYARARTDAGFRREMRLALQTGYDRLELALLESCRIEAHAHDAWRHNDPPPIPPMRPEAALQLLYLHQKDAWLGGTPPALRRRRGESPEALSMRLSLMYEWRLQRAREEFDLAEAARRERGEPTTQDMPVSGLPDLAQVTGWSKASGKASYRDGVALFGGWRIGDGDEK